MTPLGHLTLLVATLAAGFGCDPSSRASTTVFASASLTEAFEALEIEFERRSGTEVDLHCAGTARLVVQLRAGATAHVLAAADLRNMQKIVNAGLADTAPRTFAKNRLSIVMAEGNPKQVKGLRDLAREDLLAALCGPEVPAGTYARQALDKAGISLVSVSDEPSVKAIMTMVQLGEIDAGIVYETDVRSAGNTVASIVIPERHNIVARYPVTVLSSGHATTAGQAFVDFLMSQPGQRILQSFGFLAP